MTTIQLLGLTLALDDHVYEPAEDSLLLARNLDVDGDASALDVCTGTGLAALVLARQGAQTVATDVNPIACRLAEANARRNALDVHVVCTDLAAGLKHPFDLVVCNPPYLPTHEDDKVRGIVNRALDGGPDGAKLARRVIHALPRLLDDRAHALLVTSSLQPVEALETQARQAGLLWRVVDEEPLGMETLELVQLQAESPGASADEDEVEDAVLEGA